MADFLHYQHRLGVTSLYLHTQKTYKCTVANTNMLSNRFLSVIIAKKKVLKNNNNNKKERKQKLCGQRG